MRHLVALVVAVTLVGCAAPLHFAQRSDKSDVDFKQDAGQCTVQANMVDLSRAKTVYVACMQGKGWDRVP